MTEQNNTHSSATPEHFAPFENNSQSKTVGPGEGLTFENSRTEIAVYGDFVIDLDTPVKEVDALIDMLSNIRKKIQP